MDNEKGQSLIEVIVAATVGILIVAALTFATLFSLRNANFAKNSAQATKLAQEGLEKVRTLRDREGPVNYSGATKFSDLWPIPFNCIPTGTNCYFIFGPSGVLTTASPTIFENIPSTNFQRQILIEDNGSNQKKVTALVKWTDTTGPHEAKPTTILRKL